MKRNLILPCICAMLLGLPTVRGQSASPDVLNNSGGFAVIDDAVFEWSIGEFVVSTQTSPKVIVTQGLLQPIDGYTLVADPKLAANIDVFPNPSSSIINVRFNAPNEGKLACQLMDITGKVVQENSGDIKQGVTMRQLDLRLLACATYMLQVMYTTNGVPTSTTYKIQKIN